MSNYFEQVIENLRLKHEAVKAMDLPPREPIKYECPICEDRELVIIENDDGLVSARPCHCKAQKMQKRMFRASGLTEIQATLTLSDYRQTKDTKHMFDMIKDYIQTQAWTHGMGFFMSGSVGIGKTMLAMIIASEIMKNYTSVIFVPTTSLMAELRSSQFSNDQSDFEQRIDKLINADMVIFDDIGKEKPTEWVQNQYFRIIDGRYNKRKPTGYTSNYEPDDLITRFSEFGEAIVSRIVAMTRDYTISVKATDYRRP